MATTVTLRTMPTNSTTQTSPPPLSVSEIKAKIAGITAEQIELISSELVKQIMFRLGPGGKAYVAQAVAHAKSANVVPVDIATYINSAQTQQAVDEERFPFFSKTETIPFMKEAVSQIQENLTQVFAMPETFLLQGVNFSLSDDNPKGLVQDAARKAGIEIKADDIPKNYCIELGLDLGLTQDMGTFVFVLTQSSNGVAFAKKAFVLLPRAKL